MSLINEALKKAQRQRAEPAAPVASAPASVPPPVSGVATPSVRVAKRRPPMPARTQMLLLGGAAAVIVMAGVLAFLFLGGEEPPPAPVKPRPAVAAVHPAEPPAPPAVTLPPPVVPTPAPAPAEPAAVAPKANPLLVLPPSPAERAAEAAAAAKAAASAPKPAAAPSADPRVHEFLEALRITGIRVSDTDPKVIMNDRVYRLNDLVDRATGLRLTRVDPSALTFVDAAGFEYKKNF